jgi:hypothetical protein
MYKWNVPVILRALVISCVFVFFHLFWECFCHFRNQQRLEILLINKKICKEKQWENCYSSSNKRIYQQAKHSGNGRQMMPSCKHLLTINWIVPAWREEKVKKKNGWLSFYIMEVCIWIYNENQCSWLTVSVYYLERIYFSFHLFIFYQSFL